MAKKGLYGKCFQTEIKYVQTYQNNVLTKCIDARKQLKTILEQQIDTDHAYGVYIQAKKEDINEWASNKNIQNYIQQILDQGDRFDKTINNLLVTYFNDWDGVKAEIKKLIKKLGVLTEQTITSNRPADEILVDLEKHKKDITSIEETITIFIEKYNKHITKLCNDFAMTINEKYTNMKRADKEIFKTKNNDSWWRMKYGDKVLASPQSENSWLSNNLTAEVIDKLKNNKR